MHTTKGSSSRDILTIVVIVLLLLAVGFLTLKVYAPRSAIIGGSTNDAYAQGYKDARAKLSASCPFMNETSNSLSGIIISMSGNTLIVRQDSLSVDPRVDGVSDDRRITLTASTTITRIDQKDPAALAREFDAARQAQTTGATNTNGLPSPVNFPSPFTETALHLSDLKIGDRVTITSNTDLRLQANISAVSIQQNRSAATTSTTPATAPATVPSTNVPPAAAQAPAAAAAPEAPLPTPAPAPGY